MGSVILKPTQLIVVTNCVFASLWDIKSSDTDTHWKFCNLAKYASIFNFFNAGEFREPDKPYTYDDGGNTVTWLSGICNLVIECRKYGIEVTVKLDKSSAMETGVLRNYDKPYPEYTANRIVDSYFLFLINLFNRYNLGTNISTKCKKFDAYNTRIVNDHIYIPFGEDK